MNAKSEFELNDNYKKIRDNDFTLRVQTYSKNRGVIHLMKGSRHIFKTEIRTNGRGTTAIMKAIPEARKFTHLDNGLADIAQFIDEYKPLQPLKHSQNYFATLYNEAIENHGDNALSKVNEVISTGDVKFPSLFNIFTSEIEANINSNNERDSK